MLREGARVAPARGLKVSRRGPFSPVVSDTSIATLDSLIAVLHAAVLELRRGEPTQLRLSEAFALLGALYARLDSYRHPELSAHLDALYDQCFAAIGLAGPDAVDRLEVAVVLLRTLRVAQPSMRPARLRALASLAPLSA